MKTLILVSNTKREDKQAAHMIVNELEKDAACRIKWYTSWGEELANLEKKFEDYNRLFFQVSTRVSDFRKSTDIRLEIMEKKQAEFIDKFTNELRELKSLKGDFERVSKRLEKRIDDIASRLVILEEG